MQLWFFCNITIIFYYEAVKKYLELINRIN